MRVLVATRQTNGLAEGDYDFCVEGEHRATTTALVVDTALGEDDVCEALKSSLETGGWIDPLIHSDQLAGVMVDEVLADARAVAERFPLGSVVRRRLSQYVVRGTTA